MKYIAELIPGLFHDKNNQNIQDLIEKCLTVSPKILMNNLLVMSSRPDGSAFVKKFNFPLGFIIGEHDVLLSKEEWIKQTELPKVSLLTILKNSAHMGMIEEPTQSAQTIKDFYDLCSISNFIV
jgi:pimeloyl-ACP methyl ester carboxylesterase